MRHLVWGRYDHLLLQLTIIHDKHDDTKLAINNWKKAQFLIFYPFYLSGSIDDRQTIFKSNFSELESFLPQQQLHIWHKGFKQWANTDDRLWPAPNIGIQRKLCRDTRLGLSMRSEQGLRRLWIRNLQEGEKRVENLFICFKEETCKVWLIAFDGNKCLKSLKHRTSLGFPSSVFCHWELIIWNLTR